ncbi:efflux RND transporter periplasmic adaptor subunit [Zooshikella marina]|uniref:efflux RND transporter periplasmic adaptor subunit n=1 Tax=Zooshikella ganghwensis TaxID=202772 RepID=UPI001BB04147|nr:efflux RND transporter periplasmic adaptor subunit [Zooshikella ganghwensis]MBU2707375.1 efflux RND transporter periplasmic adaptor subunit [Zooshikella ganghwensis]
MSVVSYERKQPISLIATLILITFLGISTTGCEQEPITQEPPAVIVTTVKEDKIFHSIDLVGRTEASEDVNIRSRVEGTLLERHFNEGDEVKKNQLLFTLDPAPYQAVVDQSQSEIDRLQAILDEATINFDRGERLVKKGTISQSQMDELTSKKIQAESALKGAQAQLEKAALNLSYTKITAPITGRIGKSLLSLGDLVTPNQDTLATIVKLDPIYVNFQVSEKAFVDFQEEARKRISAGQEEPSVVPRLRLSNDTMYPHEGQFDFMDNRVDQTTGTIKIRAVFPNENKTLLPGQYVTLILRQKTPQQALLVPQASVQENQQGKFVLVVNSEKVVEARPVKLGQRVKTRWEVIDGLNPGETIITEGIQKVKIGGKVKPTEQQVAPFKETTAS